MSEMRYSNTKILIVTRYPLLQGYNCRCAFAMASLCLRSEFAPRTIGSTDLERTYNGPGTDLQWNSIGGMRKFSQNLIKASIDFGEMTLECFSRFTSFFVVFQAFRIRRISQKFMLIVMLLRLSAAHILLSNFV